MFELYNLPCNECSNEPHDRIVLVRVIELLDRDYRKNDLLSAERHLLYWQNEANMLGDLRSELSLCNEEIGLRRRIGNKERALKLIDRADFLIRKLLLFRTLSAGTIYLNIATTLVHFKEADRALGYYQMTEMIYSHILSKNSYEYAALYNNKASAFEAVNRFEEAEEQLQKALHVLDSLTEYKADRAITYVNLARLMTVWKHNAVSSEQYLAKAWEVLTEPTLIHDTLYAFVCEKSAEVFAYFGKKDEATALSEVAKEIYDRT